jgi:hypothetical protein
MRTVSISRILAAVAAASFAGIALVAPMQDAQAGKGGGARATTGSKFNTGVQDKAAGKLYCLGPSCPPRPSENKATTTGTNKAKLSPEVRDHRSGSQGGGVQVTDGKKRKPPGLCAGPSWACPKPPRLGTRDHRKRTGTPPGPPSPGKTQPK